MSSGSACNSRSTGPSHVVKALGNVIGPNMIGCTLRLGVGRFTTQEEVDYVAKRLISSIQELRSASEWKPTKVIENLNFSYLFVDEKTKDT